MTPAVRSAARPTPPPATHFEAVPLPPDVPVYDRLAELALRDELETLRLALLNKDEQLARLSQHELILRRQVAAMTRSWGRRLLAPVRALQSWLRPPTVTLADLLPAWQIDEDPHGGWHAWISAGTQPRFLIARWLPQGDYRLKLRLTCDRPGQLELTVQCGPEREATRRILRLPVAAGNHLYETTVTLPEDVMAMWFQPIDTPARFNLHDFHLQRTSRSAEPERLAVARPQPKQVLNIAYVLKSVGLCGGVRSALEQATRLEQRGHNVTVFHIRENADWFTRSVPTVRVPDEAAMRKALAQFRGIKIATWYETAAWVAESLRPGDHGCYLVQDIEESYVAGPNGEAEVHDTYRLGLRPLTISRWVERQLRDRFGLDPVLHSIGLDHTIFSPRDVARRSELLLTQSRTWSGGGSAGEWLKGWDTAARVIGRLHDSEPSLELATFSMEPRPVSPRSLPHRHYQQPSDDHLARLYSQAGIYLLASRHEGFGLTAAEAMACGCPVVATRAHGNEEFCVHGKTALLADADDDVRLYEHCRTLMHDREMAAELSRNARAAVAEYTWDRVIDRLEQAFYGETVTPLPTPGEGCRTVGMVTPTPPLPSRSIEYPDLDLPTEATVDWTIVIPTVNDTTQVLECIASARQHMPVHTRVDFVVVDDGSRDPAIAEMLSSAGREQGFRLVRSPQNLGFSAAINLGLHRCRGRRALLLNNDVRFYGPWLEALEAAFTADPQIGIVGGRLLYGDGRLQHAGMLKIPRELEFHHIDGNRSADLPEAQQSRAVWSVTGALFAIRDATLRDLGGLSTAYGAAYEDVDYCLMSWCRGWKVHYAADVSAYHLEGATRGATPEEKAERPLIWCWRQKAGKAFFEKKWAFVRYLDDLDGFARLVAERGGLLSD